MMPVILSRTYSVVTPESAEVGDIAESGFDWRDVPVTFRELVDYIQEHPLPSSCPGVPEWSHDEGDTDYRTGNETVHAVHPARDARSQRYWRKAWLYVHGKRVAR